MHELAICQALLTQVGDIARRNNAERVTSIVVRVGPLSGVVPALLQQTFVVARTGGVAAAADLVLETTVPRVRCRTCDRESDVPVNRLICPECGDYRTTLLSGDELILARVQLSVSEAANAPPASGRELMEDLPDV